MNSTNKSDHPRQIIALYSDIGRGHPSYLDSLLYLLKERYANIVCRTVFQKSKGLSLFTWRLISWLYKLSGKGGLQTRFYNFIRRWSQKGSEDSPATRILGRDLKQAYRNFRGICLVDHPQIARSLAGICRVWYVHGEIAAPAECAIKGMEKILVPIQETKEKLIACGVKEDALMVCGLMIEPPLVKSADRACQKRLERIGSDQPLTVGFFTSGAYPKEHMKMIMLGAYSVIQKKMKAVIFCGTNPFIFEWVKKKAKNWGAKIVEDRGEGSLENELFDLKLVAKDTRQEDTQRAIELVPDLDVLVAASHERTNWAVGLGLPMIVLFPLIGTYASQNYEFAQRQRVVYPLETPGKTRNLGDILIRLRLSGQLLQMVQNGFGTHSIDGIKKAVNLFGEVSGQHK